MKRNIIKIDEEKCDGCGNCIPNCPEGALQIIDGKARLVSDLFCDGLGACIGECPNGAITIEEREADAYSENRVMDQIVLGGPNVVKAHLRHLLEHNEHNLYKEAIEYLQDHEIIVPEMDDLKPERQCQGTCPGSMAKDLSIREAPTAEAGEASSELLNWPIQMHLVSPMAPYFKGADILLAADCVSYSVANFHSRFLKGKTLLIACPKLDTNKEIYIEKLRALVDVAKINTITLMKMEVPCCSGLMSLLKQAMVQATRKVPVKEITIGIKGEVLKEEWV